MLNVHARKVGIFFIPTSCRYALFACQVYAQGSNTDLFDTFTTPLL